MSVDERIEGLLREAACGHAITKAEAQTLLSVSEHSLEATLLRSTANVVSRRRFGNRGLLPGQIVAVVALATAHKKETTSIAVNVSNVVGLFSGANATRSPPPTAAPCSPPPASPT